MQTCDMRFKTRFGAILAVVQSNYEKYLLFLTNLKGKIEVSKKVVKLIVDVPGIPSSGQQAAARVAYVLAL